jgi:RNA polymerase-binding transcription factor DksA
MAKKTLRKKTSAKKTNKKSLKKNTKPKKKITAASKAATKKVKNKSNSSTKSKKRTTVSTRAKKKSGKTEAKIDNELSAAEQRAIKLKKIKGYTKDDLEHFRQIILEKRDEIIEQLQNLRDQMLDPTTGEYINENSPYSLHMAEQGTDAMEREKTFLYAQRENKFLTYLEDALKRIELGTYGICIECIDEPQKLCDSCPLIPRARLEAVPHSQLCLPIKQRQEKYK